MKRLPLALLLLAVLALGLPVATAVAQEPPGNPASANRETEPVVLTGERFPEWATLADVALEGPTANGGMCEVAGHENPGEGECTHNTYEDPDFQTSDYLDEEGVAIDRLLGYQWNQASGRFEQIPFQVDEMFVHYLSNNNSGFAFYSETDQHTTYAFDREGFRWLGDRRDDPAYAGDPMAPCLAKPNSEVAKDPVTGLDTDDELVFMDRDAAGRAPASALLPPGVQDSYEVAIADPTNPGVTKYAYVMLAGPDGPAAAFDETNGYVRYERDEPDARNVFLYSQSSYDGYGATAKGPVAERNSSGELVCNTSEEVQRRPGDQATITTPRYRFRYEGRWLMTGLQVSNDPKGDWTYGPDLVDQWKARAFQQRPSGETPCCGYEEEVNNWGGSSILMGELSGPVRTIRETWGADSSTNLARREIFYRDEIRLGAFLRVHVIPPLDGIYSQWDYNAGMVDTYYNPYQSDGVAIDGQNDEVFGNSRLHVGRDGVTYDGDDTVSDEIDEVTGSDEQQVGTPNEPECEYAGQPLEDLYDQGKAELPEDGDPLWDEMPGDLVDVCVFNDIDSPDPTFSGVNAGINWEQIAGPNGSLVTRSAITKYTPGSVQGMAAVPYYRDDSCFDDGTGSNPGPHFDSRSVDDIEYNGDGSVREDYANFDGSPRECWAPDDGIPPVNGDGHFWQGSIGTHGVHILLIADSDNAHTTVPVTEIDTEQRMVVLPGRQPNVGERYGRASEKPLIAIAAPETRAVDPTPPQAETTLEITGDTSGQITDQVTLAAHLAAEGAGVAGKEIVFTLDGQEVGHDETDGNGDASVTVSLEPPARDAEQGASFLGDEGHAASSATGPFSVRLDDSELAFSFTHRGKNSAATATLTDADSDGGLPGRTIHFFVKGQEVATAVTDASGVATAHFRMPKRGTASASFAGDDSYSGASSG